MNVKTFRESGLLEMYLIGACSPDEIKEVEAALEKWPELQEDIKSISRALEGYANSHKINPSSGLKDKLLKEVQSTSDASRYEEKSKKSNFSRGLIAALSIATLLLTGLSIILNNKSKGYEEQLEKMRITCDSTQAATQQYYAIYEDLQRSDNQLIALAPTENYAEASMTLFYNPVTKKNYLQLENLPNIREDQSFQLWSLKPGQDPIPLTVFQGDEGVYVSVDFEEETPTYAITVEPLGGKDAPTLSNLVGTWSIG